jgi:hypothetical protein
MPFYMYIHVSIYTYVADDAAIATIFANWSEEIYDLNR